MDQYGVEPGIDTFCADVWCVIRYEDGEQIGESFETKAEAQAEADKLNRNAQGD